VELKIEAKQEELAQSQEKVAEGRFPWRRFATQKLFVSFTQSSIRAQSPYPEA
jgi:hypothetical protein